MVLKTKNERAVQDNSDIYILLSLFTLLVMPSYFYGVRVLVVAAVALVTAIISEVVLNFMFSYKREKKDFGSIITAMIIALIMPASVAYYVVVIAVFLGLLIGKYVFGGTGKYIFNPAALGVAIVAISFPDEVLRFPEVRTILPLDLVLGDSILYQTSPASILNVGGTPAIHNFDLLLGNFVGAMGATCVVVLIAITLFLTITRSASTLVIFFSLGTVVAYSIFFPRVATGLTNSVIYELTSGVLLFGLIFIICDKTTCPKTRIGKVTYGVFVALLIMIYRTVGALDVEIVFVALVANALSAQFDIWGTALAKKIRGNKKTKTPIKIEGEI